MEEICQNREQKNIKIQKFRGTDKRPGRQIQKNEYANNRHSFFFLITGILKAEKIIGTWEEVKKKILRIRLEPLQIKRTNIELVLMKNSIHLDIAEKFLWKRQNKLLINGKDQNEIRTLIFNTVTSQTKEKHMQMTRGKKVDGNQKSLCPIIILFMCQGISKTVDV